MLNTSIEKENKTTTLLRQFEKVCLQQEQLFIYFFRR